LCKGISRQVKFGSGIIFGVKKLGKSSMQRSIHFVLLALILASGAAAQELGFPEAAVRDPATLSKTMPTLAKQLLAAYNDPNRERYLNNLFALQVVAGEYPEAVESLIALRELRRTVNLASSAWRDIQYEVYARAKASETTRKLPFEEAYRRAFRDVFGRLDDRTAARAMPLFNIVDESWMRPALESDLDAQKGKTSIALDDAVALLRDYQAVQAYHDSAPLVPALIAEDDSRRYVIEKDIQVKTSDGAIVCTLVARPRATGGRLPALLLFTIYVDFTDNLNDARVTAAHGYAGVVGFTRGKACSPDKPVPYVHDGADAATLIDWITSQPWSDGRVGMYEGSYNGFTQWAAAKHMPKGLKALMTGAPAAPGIDVPMEGNVFWNFVYPWTFYTTDAKGGDEATYNDRKRWQKLDHDWYVSGRAYRDLDKIDGTPNPIFDEWIAHPSYDSYWQSMIPYEKQFARIDIPVLTTLGYYYGGPGAGVYYFSQHQKYNPTAEHYLLIGPYDHIEAQFGVVGLLGNIADSLAGLKLDPVALLDLTDIRYQWFDYVFKGAAKPALLQDKVNYEVTGANVWKHAPSLSAMAGRRLRFHLSAAKSEHVYRLSEQEDSGEAFVPQKVDLADRSDADRKVPGSGVLDNSVDTWNGIEFISDPLAHPTELSGLFSGRLDFIANKKDFDFEIDLYELTPQGNYIQLAPYWARASYVGDLSHRRLLTPGKRHRLDIQSVRLMSRQLQQGSRVVAVLRVIKEPGRQINYGTGKDVSDETIRDAGTPLEIKWCNDSYLDLPVGK
jgi:putative CocE/NonD family hydrolase